MIVWDYIGIFAEQVHTHTTVQYQITDAAKTNEARRPTKETNAVKTEGIPARWKESAYVRSPHAPGYTESRDRGAHIGRP